MRRLLTDGRRFEFELPLAVVAGIWIEERSRGPDAVPRDAMAVGAMLAIEAAWISLLIASHRSGRQLQVRHIHDFARLDPFDGRKRRLIGRAEQRLQRLIDIAPLLLGKAFIEARRN